MGGKGSGRRPRAACGTPAAYRAHFKRKETACQPCKEAWAKYRREHYQRKGSRTKSTRKNLLTHEHKHIVRQWKLDAKNCMDCGFEINERTVICIDCDHRDPNIKTFTISYAIGRVTIEALTAELAKCDAICRNCHALRTHDNQHHLARRPKKPQQPGLFDGQPQT